MTFATLNDLRSAARKMTPTQQHRAAVWECMLGTVYAMNAAGEVRYFDYDHKAACAFVGAVDDVRVARYNIYTMCTRSNGHNDPYMLPRRNQFVWFVKDVQKGAL